MIALNGIRKVYDSSGDGLPALDDVSLTIERGEYLAVVGPSGSGKTALLSILGLLDTASSGRYLLSGYDVTALSDAERARLRNKHFGFVFRGFNLVPSLSALENAMLPMRIAGVPLRPRRERAEALLREVGIEDPGRMRSLPESLPGVDRQRVAIARALANGPDLILADEPTGCLRSGEGEEIMALLESLNERGATIVLATHEPGLGGRARRRVALLDGRISGGEVSA
jgi:putative ABC transport system ATP-binding protein